ncbi:glycosyltransferase family 1 protein [Jackrogersella minutella]|nr:glycosyltransferase family 1 protein [Jackrogersella minutella]
MSNILDMKMASSLHTSPNKKILVVVTAGGYTNAAPVLEIARIMATRGFTIEFGTFAGRESWLHDCPFISRLHILGPSVPPDVEEANYLRMSDWMTNNKQNWSAIMHTKKFLESSWPAAYNNLSDLMRDPETRPDFILADYWVDAARDMNAEFGLPIAMHWPQMPTAMLPAPYIPGTPGLQVEILTSEFATLWQRLRSSFVIYKALPQLLGYLRWRKQMRITNGVKRPLPMLTKPDYLCLVNSFFGLEAAKDIPPNVAAIGPILSDSVPPLVEPYTEFLGNRTRVLYVALGTHVLLSDQVMHRLLSGVTSALRAGTIDGIIWAIRSMARKQFRQSEKILVPEFGVDDESSLNKGSPTDSTLSMTVASLLAGEHPSILFVEHAPQRSLLQDERVTIFLSHAGPASANEAVFAGIPLITLPVYFDQLQNAMRLRDAGVSVPLRKDDFTTEDVVDAIAQILHDKNHGGPITINVERMRGISRVASRRKYLAADLIEETLADSEGRHKEGRLVGNMRPRGFHLQTADGRMPVWKTRNWDLWAIRFVGTLGVCGIIIALPIALSRL